jgi:hypothetical protein
MRLEWQLTRNYTNRQLKKATAMSLILMNVPVAFFICRGAVANFFKSPCTFVLDVMQPVLYQGLTAYFLIIW